MKARTIIGLTVFAAALAAAAPQVSGQDGAQDGGQDGGMLSTMPHGRYQCVLPGDAGGDAYRIVANAEFRLGAASSYRSQGGRGVYILKGKSLIFTRGPRKGEQFRRVGANQLQVLESNGSLGRMICTRMGRPSS